MYLRRVFSDEDTLYSVEDAIFRHLAPDSEECDLRIVLLRQAEFLGYLVQILHPNVVSASDVQALLNFAYKCVESED
jgi:hypothetical protein